MKIFITFVSILILVTSVNALDVKEVTGVDAAGTDNDGTWYITYETGTYDSLEATIDTNVGNGSIWWWGSATDSAAIANAADKDNLRFPRFESSFSGQDTVGYADNNTSNGQVFQDVSAMYVINASRVPAPLPILGILPFVGFLRKMRNRQK